MEFYTKNGSDLCLIYGNESWNDRSSCLDIKLEINNNVLWMGIDCNWDYAISSVGVSKSSQRKIKILQLCKPKHILKSSENHQGVVEERPFVVKTYVSIEEELGSLLVGVTLDGRKL